MNSMDTVIIWVRSNWERFINYDYRNQNIPNDTEIITIKQLPEDILDRIKQASFDKVNSILSNYL